MPGSFSLYMIVAAGEDVGEFFIRYRVPGKKLFTTQRVSELVVGDVLRVSLSINSPVIDTEKEMIIIT